MTWSIYPSIIRYPRCHKWLVHIWTWFHAKASSCASHLSSRTRVYLARLNDESTISARKRFACPPWHLFVFQLHGHFHPDHNARTLRHRRLHLDDQIAQSVHAYIRSYIAGLYNQEVADAVRIQVRWRNTAMHTRLVIGETESKPAIVLPTLVASPAWIVSCLSQCVREYARSHNLRHSFLG